MNNRFHPCEQHLIDSSCGHDPHRTWLLTGVCGFIGREMLRRILARPGDRVIALVRPQGERSAQSRVERILSSLYGEEANRFAVRVETLSADLSQERIGLDVSEWQRLTRSTHIVHMAARTRFDGALDEARRHNVGGVQQMLAIARAAHANGTLASFVHVSTAYVAGATTDTVCADDLDPNGPFRNVYEQSKAEAESLVRACAETMPCIVFRPSIVIGDSRNGEVANFNTIYWAIKTYLRGQRVMFARLDSSLDLVPVDYVADAMMHLLEQPGSVGRTYLLASGREGSVQLGDFAHAVAQYFGGPPLIALSPRWFWLVRTAARHGILPVRLRTLASNADAYLPYFTSNPSFDVSATEAALASSELRVPPLQSYLDKILGHCLARGLGNRSKTARQFKARSSQRAKVSVPAGCTRVCDSGAQAR